MVTWETEGHGESLANLGTAAGSVRIKAAGKLTNSSQRLVLFASCSSQMKDLAEPAEPAESRSYMMLPDATCGAALQPLFTSGGLLLCCPLLAADVTSSLSEHFISY